MVHGKRQDGAHQQGGRAGTEAPGSLPVHDESFHKRVEPPALGILKPTGKRVLFERGIDHEPQDVRVVLVLIDNLSVDRAQEAGVVSLNAQVFQFRKPSLSVRFARFVLEDCRVERVLVVEVLEDDGLGDASRLGELACGRPAEAMRREHPQAGVDELLPARLRTETPGLPAALAQGDGPTAWPRWCGSSGSRNGMRRRHIRAYGRLIVSVY